MKRVLSWKVSLVIVFLVASVGFYVLHFLIFRDAHHIFLYLIGDLGFLFIDVLVVVLFIENAESLKCQAAFGFDWEHKDFERARRAAAAFSYHGKPDPAKLAELRTFMLSERGFLLTLLENPNILVREFWTTGSKFGICVACHQ